ncbi:MAG: ADP-glyceromanno-heptose 6-epimerase [Rhodospirillales bacterium]
MYLVTGGAGFIGSNLTAALVERGERVVVADRLGQDDKWLNIAKLLLDDIVSPEALPDWLAQAPDLKGVIHLGAISATTERDMDLLVRNNLQLSQAVWRCCAERRLPLIYASSAATYGDGEAGFDDDSSPQALARLRPLNGYGWSKHLFDRWALREVAEGRPRPPQWVGLKFFNVYGPNEYHKGGMRSVAHRVFHQAQAGGPATLFASHRPDYADGEQLRDFVYVEDCVSVMLWLLETGRASGLFNLGTGEAQSFNRLARAVFAALNQVAKIDYVPTPESLRPRYQYFTQAKMDRLRAAGYDRPFLSVEDGVARYVHDHLLNQDPYR